MFPGRDNRRNLNSDEDEMFSPPNSERLIGGVIAVVGAVYCLHTLGSFDLGNLRRMGPGMFPLILGVVMTLLGLGIAVIAPERDRPLPDFEFRTMAFVLAGVAAFALTIAWFGMFPAVAMTVLVASLAERPFKPVAACMVAAVLCVAAWLIFKLGLGLSIPMLRWPF